MNEQVERVARSRRTLVSGLGGAGLAAGLLTASRNAEALGGGTAISGFFDVTKSPYNAVGDGVTDAQPGIQAAINAAQANGGGIVWIPPGVYKLASGLIITSQVIVEGAGWTTPQPDNVGSPNNNTGNGTWFSISSTAFTPIRIKGFGVGLRDVAFIHQQATSTGSGWTPVDYPFTIEINYGDTALQNIFLRNATRGILIRGSQTEPGNSAGRITLKHIWGQAIITGVQVDNVLDAMKIDDVHFWPFWSYSPAVLAYQLANACCGFIFKRCDNPHLSNILISSYNIGFYFSSSPASTIGGITSRFLMSNCGVDESARGIYIDGAGTSGQVSNYYFVGSNAYDGIEVNAANVILQCSNIRCSVSQNNAVRVYGAGSVVTVENIIVEFWNQSGIGFPAFEVGPSANLYLGHSTVYLTNSGPLTGGAGTLVSDN